MTANIQNPLDRLSAGWRAYALVALIALLGALPGVFALPVMDRDEARFAQATAQMLETGDFVRINVQEVPRNKKPIGIHWLQAASVALTSHVQDRAIWAYRLPSILGAMLAACATFWAGAALFDRRTALIGASLFGAGLLIGFEGMTAKTDAALCGFTTLAMAALAHLRIGATRPRATALVFWAALGAGVLIKGPVTPMVAALALLALGLWERRWAWMKPLAWAPGPLLAALIVLPWMIAIGAATQGRFFVEAVGVDLAPKLAGGAEGHGQPPGYYLALLSLLIFPATFALPNAARLAWRTLRAPRLAPEFDTLRFLLAWAIPTFVVFELLPTKLAHYTLPTYPALSLLCAAGLAQARGRWTTAIGATLFALAGAGLIALCVAGGHYMTAPTSPFLLALLSLLLIAALASFALNRWRIAAAIVVALAASFAIRQAVLPAASTLLVSDRAAQMLQAAGLNPRLSPAAPPLWIVGYAEASLVFETATHVRLASPDRAGAEAQAGDTIVAEARARPALDAALAARGLSLADTGGAVSGLNYANGDQVTLALARVLAR